MAAPTPTARVAPTGIPLENGHPVHITCELNPAIEFWEIAVKPFKIEIADIKTSNQFNTSVHTYSAAALAELGECEGEAMYDPIVMAHILGLTGTKILGVNTVWTYTYPDNSTEAFWAFLKSFDREQNEEAKLPKAKFVIRLSNHDNSRIERVPVLANIPGT